MASCKFDGTVAQYNALPIAKKNEYRKFAVSDDPTVTCTTSLDEIFNSQLPHQWKAQHPDLKFAPGGRPYFIGLMMIAEEHIPVVQGYASIGTCTYCNKCVESVQCIICSMRLCTGCIMDSKQDKKRFTNISATLWATSWCPRCHDRAFHNVDFQQEGGFKATKHRCSAAACKATIYASNEGLDQYAKEGKLYCSEQCATKAGHEWHEFINKAFHIKDNPGHPVFAECHVIANQDVVFEGAWINILAAVEHKKTESKYDYRIEQERVSHLDATRFNGHCSA